MTEPGPKPGEVHPFVIDWNASNNRDVAVCVHCGCIESFHMHDTESLEPRGMVSRCPCPIHKPGVDYEEANAMLTRLLGFES